MARPARLVPPMRLRILEAALEAFAEEGFGATTMRDIARRAGCSLGASYSWFPSKHALALALYDRLAVELESRLDELPDGSVAERFSALTLHKLDLLDTHRDTLAALVAAAMDPDGPIGVLSDATSAVRSKVSGAYLVAVAGASDAPDDPAERRRMGRLLYGLHLLVVLVWSQDRDGSLVRLVLATLADGLGMAPLALALPHLRERLEAIDTALGQRFLSVPSEGEEARVVAILERLFRHRRVLAGVGDPSAASLAPHRPRVEAAVREGRPLHLVLPAFPAKSPSPLKTLGPLPDLAESLALRHLQALCDELSEAHPPGVVLTLCSDGGVFADVVGVPDADVRAYGEAIDREIAGLPSVRRFDLRHAFPDALPEGARAALLERWAESPEALGERLAASPALRSMLDGLHRFAFEDRLGVDTHLSKTQIRKQARPRAKELLRRSRAWGRLVSACFPDALRLSIHPQPDVSEKIGVHLVPTEDAWLTPWHGVAVLDGQDFALMHRQDAESRGAVAVSQGGRPVHFEVPGSR